MTNPGNAVGTNAAYGGRTSVNAFNDGLAAYSRGILSGWACEPDTGMTVSLGGDSSIRDVAIAEDNAGNKTTINNISGSPVNVTLTAAPGANSRIDAIVAYVDNPAQGASTVADNPSACGIIAVAGIAAADPSEPSDNAIRTAITADGASGPTAYYVVLATVTVANGTTDLTSGDITAGSISKTTVESAIQTYLNLSNFTSPTVSVTNGTINVGQTSISCASNADGTLGKIYGRISFASTAASSVITFATPFRPSTTLTINGVAFNQWSDDSYTWSNLIPSSISIATNGTATMTISGSSSGRERRFILTACLLFIESFGDTLIS